MIYPNKNSPRNHAIDTISIHCVVGQLTAKQVGNIFQNTASGRKKVNAKIGVQDTMTNKSVEKSGSKLPYMIKASIQYLRVRRGPGTNYGTNGTAKPGIYTIIEEANGIGATRWGRLNSKAGWISLDYVTKCPTTKK